MRRYVLASIVVLALLYRLVLLFDLSNHAYYAGLSQTFGEAALRLTEGRGLSQSPTVQAELYARQNNEARLIDLEEYRAVAVSDLEPSTYALPGYSVLLALSYRLFGEARYIYLRWLQLALDGAIATLLVYYIGSRLFGGMAGLIAAFLYAVYRPVAFLSITALPDSLVSLAILCAVAALLTFATTRRWRYVAAAGVAIAAGCYLRPDVVTLVPFAALAIGAWCGWQTGVKAGGWLLALWATALLPFGLYNLAATGQFQMARPAVGVNLWEGIGEYDNPCGMAANDLRAAAAMERDGTHWGTGAGDRVLLEQFIECVKAHPLLYASNIVQRLPRAFAPLGELGQHPAFTVAVYALALVGLWRTRDNGGAWLLLCVVLARSVPFAFLHVEDRWIVVGHGALLVLSACGVVALVGIRAKSERGIRTQPAPVSGR